MTRMAGAIGYVRRQGSSVRAGDFSHLIRLAAELLALGPAFLLLVVVRSIRPVLLVRFSRLPTARIGTLAAIPELYLCERDQGMHSPRTVDIFYTDSIVCNPALAKMWTRALHIHQFARQLGRVNHLLPGGKQHAARHRPDALYEKRKYMIRSLLEGSPAHLRFTPEEEGKARREFHQLGIPEGVPFVCFHARDPAYTDVMFPSKDSQRHLYGNSSIHNCVPAADELARRGHFAIRMGAVVSEPLATTNPKIIDYATDGRTDLLDIYLSSKCAFFICGISGLRTLPMIFRRPCAHINCSAIDLAPNWNSKDLFIPKKLWWRQERRYLTFTEFIGTELGRTQLSSQFDQKGIELIENTPEEITSLAVEMDERLKGTWQETEEDLELQARFQTLYEPLLEPEIAAPRIGAQFLRENRELLDYLK